MVRRSTYQTLTTYMVADTIYVDTKLENPPSHNMMMVAAGVRRAQPPIYMVAYVRRREYMCLLMHVPFVIGGRHSPLYIAI